MATQSSAKVKKVKRRITSAMLYIGASFNNTIITATDEQGNVIAWSSAGAHGFKGSKKATPYAAQITSEAVAVKMKECGVVYLKIKVKGPGAGRESALRALQAHGFSVSLIEDTTYHPHNGCRPPKKRRV